MKRTILISGLLILFASSIIGFFGSQFFSELQAEVSSYELYDDTEITASINNLISTINNLETTDTTELENQIDSIQGVIDSIEDDDDSVLETKVANLEVLVQELNTLITSLQSQINSIETGGSTNSPIYVSTQGRYLEFNEVADQLCTKYLNFNDPMIGCYSGGSSSSYSLYIQDNNNTLTKEEIMARIALFFDEFSQYHQYIHNIEKIELTYSYSIGDVHYRYYVVMPTAYLIAGEFHYLDVLPSDNWKENRCVSEVFTEEFIETPIVIDNDLFSQTYNNYITNNTFGGNILVPKS